MWLHNPKEYYLILNILFSSFSVLRCEDENAIAEYEDIKWPEDEEPAPESYPSYQTICTDLPQYKKLSERVTKIFLDFEEKFDKLEAQVSKLTEDLKMCNMLTSKLESDVKDVKKSESSFKGKIEEQIEAIEKKLKKYFSKLSDAEREVEELDKNLSNRNKQLTGLEDKYEAMEDSMKKINTNIEELIKRNEEQDKSQEEQMKKVEDKMVTLETNMTVHDKNTDEMLSNVTISLNEALLARTTTVEKDMEPTVVEVPEVVLDVKIFTQFANSLRWMKGQENIFHVPNATVKSDWKFYLTITTDKSCQRHNNINIEACQFIGVYLKLVTTHSTEQIAARFQLIFQEVLGQEIKSQTSSLKEFKPSTKYGWPAWISVKQLMEEAEIRDNFNFHAVLKLYLYPEGSYLYDDSRTSETQIIEWELPDIQNYIPDSHTKNVSTSFKIGNETGVYTEWRTYLGYKDNYLKVGIQLLESSWKIVYASWKIELYDFNENLRATTSTYAKAYQEGAEAIKDSHFLSLDKLYSWKRTSSDQSITMKIYFTIYGKGAKLYKDDVKI